jgi:hypothetical protein
MHPSRFRQIGPQIAFSKGKGPKKRRAGGAGTLDELFFGYFPTDRATDSLPAGGQALCSGRHPFVSEYYMEHRGFTMGVHASLGAKSPTAWLPPTL